MTDQCQPVNYNNGWVTTLDRGDDSAGYFKPAPLCWEVTKADSATSSPKSEATTANTTEHSSTLKATQPDVTGDGLPDQFVVAETGDQFLIRLNHGVCEQTIVETCGDGEYYRTLIDETTPSTVIAIDKSKLPINEADRVVFTDISWDPLVGGGRLTIEAQRTGADGVESLTWTLSPTECPPPKKPEMDYLSDGC